MTSNIRAVQFFRITQPPQQVDSRRLHSTTAVDRHNSYTRHPSKQAVIMVQPAPSGGLSESCVSAIAVRWQTFEC